jgi:hypothetical protein
LKIKKERKKKENRQPHTKKNKKWKFLNKNKKIKKKLTATKKKNLL